MRVVQLKTRLIRYNKTEAHARRIKRFFKPLQRNFILKRSLRALMRTAAAKRDFKLRRRIAMVYTKESLYGRYSKKYCVFTGWLNNANWLHTSKYVVKPFMKAGLIRDFKKF